jgi:hypothetical protein
LESSLQADRVQPGRYLETLVEQNHAFDDAVFGVDVTKTRVLDEEPSLDPAGAQNVVAQVLTSNAKETPDEAATVATGLSRLSAPGPLLDHPLFAFGPQALDERQVRNFQKFDCGGMVAINVD